MSITAPAAIWRTAKASHKSFHRSREVLPFRPRLPDTVIHVVLAGAKMAATTGKPTGFAMPAFDWKLDDKEVADLVNYIRNAWGNHASLTSSDAVSKVRKDVEHGGG